MKKVNNLAFICKMTQNELLYWLTSEMRRYYKARKIKVTDDYLYVKGTLPICLVCHLDTVHIKRPKEIYYDVETKSLFSPQGIGGDDRCGVYIILELLKKGLRPSVIFCCDEEIGGLGAGEFAKAYSTIDNVNWFLEFDRKGRTDVVCYDDDNPELTEVFEKFGFKSAWGSFSDISELAPHFGISAVNLSSGYYLPHTTSEYIKMDDLEWIISKAEEVLRSEYVNNKYKYIEHKYTYSRYDYSYDTKYTGYSVKTKCDVCGKHEKDSKLKITAYGLVCDDCIKELGMKYCDTCGVYSVHENGKCELCDYYEAMFDEKSSDPTVQAS